jgi:hypothetical protein
LICLAIAAAVDDSQGRGFGVGLLFSMLRLGRQEVRPEVAAATAAAAAAAAAALATADAAAAAAAAARARDDVIAAALPVGSAVRLRGLGRGELAGILAQVRPDGMCEVALCAPPMLDYCQSGTLGGGAVALTSAGAGWRLSGGAFASAFVHISALSPLLRATAGAAALVALTTATMSAGGRNRSTCSGEVMATRDGNSTHVVRVRERENAAPPAHAPPPCPCPTPAPSNFLSPRVSCCSQLSFATAATAPEQAAPGVASAVAAAAAAAASPTASSRSLFLGRRHTDLISAVPPLVAGAAAAAAAAANGGSGTVTANANANANADGAGDPSENRAAYLRAQDGGTFGGATVYLHPFSVLALLPAARGDLVATRYGPGVVLAVRVSGGGGSGRGGVMTFEIAMLKWRLAGGALVKLFCQPEEVRKLGNDDVKKVADSRCRVM